MIDAVDFCLPPGKVCVRESGHIPVYLTAQKVSVHQNSVSEVLGLAEFRGRMPSAIAVVGMQAAALGYGRGLSAAGVRGMEVMGMLCLDVLAGWGVWGKRRKGDAGDAFWVGKLRGA